jgi:hypothetical protein
MRPAKAGLFRSILTAVATIACLPVSGQTAASTPQALVTRFYTLYIKHHTGGLSLEEEARRTLRPLLSEDLRRSPASSGSCSDERPEGVAIG